MYCRAQFVELSRYDDDLAELDAHVLAISTDDLRGASYIADSIDLPFPVLYNPEADVVKEYGVYNLLRDRLATPSTFIVDKNGVIRWKYIGKGISDRPSSQEVINQLRRLDS